MAECKNEAAIAGILKLKKHRTGRNKRRFKELGFKDQRDEWISSINCTEARAKGYLPAVKSKEFILNFWRGAQE